jgi:hypothetical protein
VGGGKAQSRANDRSEEAELRRQAKVDKTRMETLRRVRAQRAFSEWRRAAEERTRSVQASAAAEAERQAQEREVRQRDAQTAFADWMQTILPARLADRRRPEYAFSLADSWQPLLTPEDAHDARESLSTQPVGGPTAARSARKQSSAGIPFIAWPRP